MSIARVLKNLAKVETSDTLDLKTNYCFKGICQKEKHSNP